MNNLNEYKNYVKFAFDFGGFDSSYYEEYINLISKINNYEDAKKMMDNPKFRQWTPSLIFNEFGFKFYQTCDLNKPSPVAFVLFNPLDADKVYLLDKYKNNPDYIYIEKNIKFSKRLISVIYGCYPWFISYARYVELLNIIDKDAKILFLYRKDGLDMLDELIDFKNKFRKAHEDMIHHHEFDDLEFKGTINPFHTPNPIEVETQMSEIAKYVDLYIIGLHSGHDASACLYKTNELIGAIEKERLTRIKHDSDEPIECIEYLLDANNLTYDDIDLVIRVNWYDFKHPNDEYYTRFKNVIINKNHHLFHAYALSLVGQDDKYLGFIIDGRGCRNIDSNPNLTFNGEFESFSLYEIDHKHVKELKKEYKVHYHNKYRWGSFMDTVGYAYDLVCKIIFNDRNAGGKIMALASLGEPNANIPSPFIYDDNNFEINDYWIAYLKTIQEPTGWENKTAYDIAYNIQKALEDYYLFITKKYTALYHNSHIGFAGGVALNCKNNGYIANQDYIDKLYLYPACGDNGISIGAGVYAIRKIFNNYNDIKWHFAPGRKYITTTYNDDDLEQVVDLLNQGEFVGIFEDGSEYGPRALCHRSILACAHIIDIKEKLNNEIKHRERFRPFGGVLLRKNLSKVTDEVLANDYMLSAVHIKKERHEELQALVHYDKTIRLQVVDDNEGLIAKILKRLEEKYQKIVIINTSFNSKGEPIIETPDDAYKCAKHIGLKYLYIAGKLEKVIND